MDNTDDSFFKLRSVLVHEGEEYTVDHDDVWQHAYDEYCMKQQKEIIPQIFCKLDFNTLLQVQTFLKIRDEFDKLKLESDVFKMIFDLCHRNPNETDQAFGSEHNYIYEMITEAFYLKIEMTGLNFLDFYEFYYGDFVRIMIDCDKELERKALGYLDLQDNDSWADLLMVFLENTNSKKKKFIENTEKIKSAAERNDAIVYAAIASNDDIVAKKIFTRMLTRVQTFSDTCVA